MTTIAYAAGVLASDTACTVDGVWMSSTRKIARAPDGTIGGCCGTIVGIAGFLAWIDDGASGQPDLAEGVSGLLVRPDGTVWLAETGGPLTLVDAPFHSTGTGREIALGAMAAGADAERAVQIACRYDGKSREPIQIMRLGSE